MKRYKHALNKYISGLVIVFLAVGSVSAQGIADLEALVKELPPDMHETKMIPLAQVLNKLEANRHISFVYESGLLEGKQTPEDVLSSPDLAAKLGGLLKEQGLAYHKQAKGTYVIRRLAVQTKKSGTAAQISGTVTDAETGETLPGVNILVKGTSTGASTNAEGHYELEVENLQDTLVVSFVGYKTRQVPINGRTEVNVALQKQAISGEEMVVVGYGEERRAEVTGSISEVSGKEISESPTNNITQAIQGKIPGVVVNDRGGEPGNNNTDFLVRGKGTLGNNSPLIVIDGVPRNKEDFANLSSNDIKSINVLKDASAAIYGARAANGVILVTTKKGNVGKPRISISSNYGIQTIPNFPEAMTTYQRAKYFNEFRLYEGQQPQWSDEALQHFKKGDQPLQYPTTDWADWVLADYAPQTHHNIAAQGGTENIQYYISGDYRYQQGMVKSGDINYNQYQMRARINSNITDNLKVGINLMGRKEKNHAPAATDDRIWRSILYDYPWIKARWPNGSLGPGMNTGDSPITNTNDEYGASGINRYTFNSKVSFEYQLAWLTKGLQFSGYANFNYKKRDLKNFANIWTAYDYDVQSKEYIPLNGHSRDARGFGNTSYTRQLENQVNFDSYTFYHLRLSYENSFNKNDISVFAAYEQTESSNNILSGYRKGLPSDKKTQLFAGQNLGKDNFGSASLGGRINYFGSISYDYASKYMLDFSLRYDGSFNFPKGKRFGLFPALSAGWNVTEEPFMDGAGQWLDNLKLRASWGKMGNDRVPSYQYLTTYQFGGSSNLYAFGVSPKAEKGFDAQNIANPNITWETSYKTNIGIDLSVYDSMLNLSIDAFSERRRDILIARNASVPDYTAISLPDQNLGKVNNKGLELALNHQNTVGNISYNFGGNLTYNRSKILYMDEAKDIPNYQKKEGHPIDSWLVYKANGLFQSQSEIENNPSLPGTQPGDIRYVDINDDGNITGKDRIRKYSSATPEIQYGFNIGLNYKNVGLNLFFQGQTNAMQRTFTGEGLHLIQPYFTKRWTPENTNAEFPRAFSRDDDFNTRPSTFWLYDASYLRLKNVRFSYSLPTELTSRIGMSQLEVYLSGRNLLTWDNMLGNWDPERTAGGGYHYPQVQTFLIGTNISF